MGDPGFNPDAGGTTTTGGTTSGSTSSGSSSSSSSSSSSTKAKPPTEAEKLAERRANRAFAELQRTYLESLRRWGIPATKNMMNLIERGIRKAWSTTTFLAMVRHTPEYKKRFHGISWKTGMTEGQYLSTYAQYKGRAQDIGITLSKKDFAQILKKGIDPEEFSDRVDALASMKAYQPMWDQLVVVAQERGIVAGPNKLDTQRELRNLAMGIGSAQWEKLFQETLITANLQASAGYSVVEPGRGEVSNAENFYEVTRDQMLNIIQGVEGLTPGFDAKSITARDWAQIGKDIRKYPLSYLKRYGLTGADLLEMELGGPRALEIGQKAERILAEHEAFTEPRATPRYAAIEQADQKPELPQSL